MEAIAGRRAGDLPGETTSFVGRRAELADVVRLLRRSRLVTLTGAGGVGKTRLARRAAAARRRSFPEGVWWVGLSGLQDGALLAHTVAAVLGLADQSSRPQIEVLADFLADKRLLLVLDTCEHLVDPCAMLAEALLRASPRLRILATSRERLGATGEQLYVVPPLPLPDPEQPAGDAVRLFAERAAAVDPQFRLDAQGAAAAARLCGRLDGLPLAIELAAGWVRTLSVEQLSARLDDRFRLLEGRGQAADPRHETLRTAIGWSHELCGPAERLMWARVSVFPADFDLEAAEGICAGPELPAPHTFEVLSSLVDKSILLARQTPSGPRFRMLDTVREYGRGWLRMLDEETALLRRHRDHYLDLARRFDEAWHGTDQAAWLDRMRLELPNIRAALEFCLATPGEQHAALDLAGRLNFLWHADAQKEGAFHLDRALKAAPEPTRERARALWGRSGIAATLADVSSAAAHAAEARDLAERLGDPEASACAAYFIGLAHVISDDPIHGIPSLQQAVDEFHHLPRWSVVHPMALMILGMGHLRTGRPDTAISLLEQAHSICQEHGEIWTRSHCEHLLANAELSTGALPAAQRHALASLRTKVRLQDTFGILMALDALAGATASTDPERAARLLGIAQTLDEAIGTGYAGLTALRSVAESQAQELLDADTYKTALQQGRQLPHDQALAYALGEQPGSNNGAAASPLTARQSEIAELVAEGLSNRDIAARLLISKRTVDSHVEHILSKLGFSSRVQIAAWITQHRR